MPSTIQTARRPWNLGRIIGPKPPFKPKRIWAIRTRLQHEGRTRDLALFDTAIDSKLRGCDLVRLRVADVHLGDGVRVRTTIVQQKTGRPVPIELTETTRETLPACPNLRGLRAGDWLFRSGGRPGGAGVLVVPGDHGDEVYPACRGPRSERSLPGVRHLGHASLLR